MFAALLMYISGCIFYSTSSFFTAILHLKSRNLSNQQRLGGDATRKVDIVLEFKPLEFEIITILTKTTVYKTLKATTHIYFTPFFKTIVFFRTVFFQKFLSLCNG